MEIDISPAARVRQAPPSDPVRDVVPTRSERPHIPAALQLTAFGPMPDDYAVSLGRLLLLAALGAGACLVGVELMITAVALPGIVAHFGDWTLIRHASWVVNGYLLAYIATMPLAGRAADRYGLPLLFQLALLVFAAGSLLAGAAQTLDQLIAARVLQGMGGGAIVPLATAGASHLFAGAPRARALGAVAALTFLGMAIGPFAGAAVLETFEIAPVLDDAGLRRTLAFDLLAPAWRWVFYLGAPVAILAMAYLWAAAPAWPRSRAGAGLDLLGAALFTVALAAALLALTWVGEEAGPLDPAILALIAIAATILVVLRLRTAREPFLEPRLFTDRIFASAMLVSLLTGYALATAIVGGAVFVDRVRYGGPEEQRIALGALAGAMALGALGSGFVLRRTGVVLISLFGLGLGTAGLGLLAFSRPSTALIVLAAGLALFGLGFGVTVTPRSTAAVEALGRGAYGVASAGVTVARMLGMAVGLAVLTAIGSNRIKALSVVEVDQAARDAVLPPGLRGRPLEDGLVVEALERWAAGEAAGILTGLFAIAAAVMVLAIVPALMMGRGNTGDGEDAADTAGRGAARDDEGEAALAL